MHFARDKILKTYPPEVSVRAECRLKYTYKTNDNIFMI